MTLLEKQQIFALLNSRFVVRLCGMGYKVTFGEAYRPPETAKLYAQQGKGIRNSLHELKLAKDLNLFKEGRFLISIDEYREAGEIWKSYSTDEYECCWGGDFHSRPDADHFSIEHNGVK
jgi:hypothetical protein